LNVKKLRRREESVMKKKTILKSGLMGAAMILLASPASARPIELKGAGTALWIFLIIGAIIVLLQLIPAILLFFSFIGTATSEALKKEKKSEVGIIVPAIEPAPVRK